MTREAKSYIARGFGFFVVLEVMLVFAIIFWPSFAQNVDSLKSMASPVPMLRGMVEQLEQGGVSAYVVGQHFFKSCNTLGAAAAVLFAMGAIAGEAHRATLEIWLARPVTRTRLLTERFVAGLTALAIPIFATSLTIPKLLETVDETMAYGELMWCSLHATLFVGMIYAVTFLLSSLGSQPMRIAFVMLFASIFEFAIYMVKTITHWSLFRLSDIEVYTRITMRDGPALGTGLILATVILACYVGSLFALRRRVP